MSQAPLTMGQVAARYGVQQHHVRRIFQRGLLPEPLRVGAYRVVPVEDLPKVEAALRRAGYIPAEAEAVASS
jgi:DNA-binding transcriptional MerR regulator